MRILMMVILGVLMLMSPSAWAQQSALQAGAAQRQPDPGEGESQAEPEEEAEPLSEADQAYQDAISLLQAGQLQAGLRKIDSALEADEFHAPSLLLLGEVAQQKGEAEEAKGYFNKIVEGSKKKTGMEADDYFHLGTAHYYLGNFKAAIYGLEKAISLRVDVDIKMIIPMLFSSAIQSENMDRAVMYAKKYVDIEPENKQALMTLISALFQKQNYREAEEYAKQLLDIDFDNVDAYMYLAMAQFYQQKFTDTIINAGKAINRGGDSSELYYMLAVSLYEDEVYLNAIPLFKKYLEDVPDDYRAYLYLGQSHQGVGEYDEAEEAYNKAMELQPEDPYVHYQLGTLYEFGHKKMRGALPHYRTAMSLAKKSGAKQLIPALEERIENVEYETSWWPFK